ncbi:MAG: hypothetical protein JSU63_01495 [Phycisphaerales bacterium]|nr:MAG: hypothetical protein JSU63_01495 [Phycisphaerales bacterium]
MAGLAYDDIKDRVRFTPQDATNVKSLRRVVAASLPGIAERLHAEIRDNPEIFAVFTAGGAEVKRQQANLLAWLGELFAGADDLRLNQATAAIGRANARHKLPQHYMVTGMESIWLECERVVQDTQVTQMEEKLHSLRKLLTLQLAIMLQSYKEAYAEQVREEEQTLIEERLTRAEHLARIGQLAASLAHEIKNPLAGISGAIQIIRDGMADDDVHRLIINEIIAQIKRLDETVKDLLFFARPTPPNRAKFSLEQAIARVLTVLQEEPALHGVEIVCDEVSRDAMVLADTRQIEQLVMNLLINAAHATPDGGRIALSIAGNDDCVRLSIVDEGSGMPPDVQEHAFEPFFTTKAKGTGLGLSICRRIIEVHGGDIRLESEVGIGTKVTVTLPRPREHRQQGNHR